ncbi:unnamed protein product [Effrenium voratum]|nr:unnamed protein product [Effrenium voratum]
MARECPRSTRRPGEGGGVTSFPIEVRPLFKDRQSAESIQSFHQGAPRQNESGVATWGSASAGEPSHKLGDVGPKVIPLTQSLEGRQTREETLSNGAVYVGQWKGQARDGFGKQTWPDGASYEGSFQENKAAGYGKFIHADGDIYEGEWQNDKAHGHGRYQHMDGSTYEGEWIADKQPATERDGEKVCGLLTSTRASENSTGYDCDANGSCMNAAASLQCESMKAICGESMMIMESCPLQFNCPTCTCGEACTMSSGSVGECGEDGMTCAMFFAPPNCTTTTADTGTG